MLKLLLINVKMMKNRFRAMTFADEAKTAFFLFLNFLFLLGIYAASYRLISYLNDVPVIGALVVNKLLTMVFLAAFMMTLFSAVITSFSTIYFSRDLAWLISMPLPSAKIFVHKALNTVFYASWMVFAAMVPFTAALAAVKSGGLAFFTATLILLVPFLASASLCGVIISMLLVKALPARRVRDSVLAVGALFLMGIFILMRFMEPEKLARPDGMDAVAQYLSFLDAPSAVYLPSWWITGALFAFLGSKPGVFFFYAGLLAGGSLLLFAAAGVLSERIFLSGWAQEHAGINGEHDFLKKYGKRSPFAALLGKDARVFIRDANQWSQLLFLGALSAVYLFSVYKIPLETMYLQNLVAFFNVGLIGIVSSAVALRFVFPSISLEGENFWIIRSSPLTPGLLMAEKTVFGSIPVIFLALLLSAASGIILKTDAPVFVGSVIAAALLAAGLASMAAGFGAVFPKFSMTSIAQIESSSGGLFFILAALFYVGLNLSLWAVPLQNYYMAKFRMPAAQSSLFLFAGAGIILLNAGAVVLPFKLGVRALKRMET